MPRVGFRDDALVVGFHLGLVAGVLRYSLGEAVLRVRFQLGVIGLGVRLVRHVLESGLVLLLRCFVLQPLDDLCVLCLDVLHVLLVPELLRGGVLDAFLLRVFLILRVLRFQVLCGLRVFFLQVSPRLRVLVLQVIHRFGVAFLELVLLARVLCVHLGFFLRVLRDELRLCLRVRLRLAVQLVAEYVQLLVLGLDGCVEIADLLLLIRDLPLHTGPLFCHFFGLPLQDPDAVLSLELLLLAIEQVPLYGARSFPGLLPLPEKFLLQLGVLGQNVRDGLPGQLHPLHEVLLRLPPLELQAPPRVDLLLQRLHNALHGGVGFLHLRQGLGAVVPRLKGLVAGFEDLFLDCGDALVAGLDLLIQPRDFRFQSCLVLLQVADLDSQLLHFGFELPDLPSPFSDLPVEVIDLGLMRDLHALNHFLQFSLLGAQLEHLVLQPLQLALERLHRAFVLRRVRHPLVLLGLEPALQARDLLSLLFDFVPKLGLCPLELPPELPCLFLGGLLRRLACLHLRPHTL